MTESNENKKELISAEEHRRRLKKILKCQSKGVLIDMTIKAHTLMEHYKIENEQLNKQLNELKQQPSQVEQQQPEEANKKENE